MRRNHTAFGFDDLFTAAALGETTWLTALADLAARTGSARAQIVGIGGPTVVPFNWVNDLPEQGINEFIDIQGGSPDVNYRVAASCTSKLMQVVGEREYASITDGKDRSTYADYCARWDIPFGCQTTLIQNEGRLVGLATLRTRADRETTEDQLSTFARIAPSAQAAIRLSIALEDQGALLLAGTLDHMSVAAVICDRTGRVQAVTSAADVLLSSGGALEIRGGQLTALTDPDRLQIDGLLAALLRPDTHMTARMCGPIVVGTEDRAGGALTVEGHVLTRRDWAFSFLPQAVLTLRQTTVSHFVARHLSPRERECLQCLANGLRPDAIADRLRIAKVTVDLHLTNARRKLGCRTMAETVARAVQHQQISC